MLDAPRKVTDHESVRRSSSWGLPGVARPPCGPSSCGSASHSFEVTLLEFTLLPSSSNNPASLTARLGATIDVEQNHVRFLGDLILNLWDCGGQDAFMDSYLTTQRSTIFKHVGVMIYVFDAETREMNKDLEYYRDCLDGLRTYSPEASVFLLVHKMDLVRDRNAVFTKKQKELTTASAEALVTIFGTSIYDESLYKAGLSSL